MLASDGRGRAWGWSCMDGVVAAWAGTVYGVVMSNRFSTR